MKKFISSLLVSAMVIGFFATFPISHAEENQLNSVKVQTVKKSNLSESELNNAIRVDTEEEAKQLIKEFENMPSHIELDAEAVKSDKLEARSASNINTVKASASMPIGISYKNYATTRLVSDAYIQVYSNGSFAEIKGANDVKNYLTGYVLGMAWKDNHIQKNIASDGRSISITTDGVLKMTLIVNDSGSMITLADKPMTIQVNYGQR